MEVGQSPEEVKAGILEKRHERLVAETTEKVKRRLKLDQGLPKVSPDIKERMTATIAETVVETGEVLNVSLPEIRLAYKWDDKEEERKHKRKTLKIGVNYLDENGRKKGVILFTPWYLKELAQFMRFPIPVRERHEDDIRLAIAHEMYHFRADKKFPQVAARSAKQIGEKERFKISKWSASRVEYAAELFARKYLENRKAEGWRQIVGKSLALSEKQLILQLMKMFQRLAEVEQRLKKAKKKPFLPPTPVSKKKQP